MELPKKVNSLILSTNEDRIDENFYYLTEISKNKRVSATAIVNGKGTTVLTNRLEHGLFNKISTKGASGGLRKIIVEKKEQFEKIIKQNAKGKVGMNLSYISFNSAKRYRRIVNGKIIDVSKELGEMRAIKTNTEMKKIKEACRITEEIFGNIELLLHKSRTEKDLAVELDIAARRASEGNAYPTIVAFGKGSALPHYSPGNIKIGKGLLLIDFGVMYDGYCADLTRTFFVGRADEKAKRVYEIVHRAQLEGIKLIKNNARASDIHKAASRIIKKELNQDLIHSFGHGLGIEVHDYPESIGGKSKTILKNKMVITAEPGYYETGWGGIRIEDDVVVGIRKPIIEAPASLTEL
jgi:Xaa-Pro dipeptidase